MRNRFVFILATYVLLMAGCNKSESSVFYKCSESTIGIGFEDSLAIKSLFFSKIDDKDINQLTSEQLAFACILYPRLFDAFFYSPLTESVTNVLERFNGYHELLKRQDGGKAMVKALSIYKENVKSRALSKQEYAEAELRIRLITILLDSDAFVPFELNVDRNFSLISNELFLLYTPNGSRVQDVYTVPEDLTPDQISYMDNYCLQNYPSAVLVNSASSTYNCHFYAWTGLYPNRVAWLGFHGVTAEDIYWEDLSYIETTSEDPDAEIVSYASDNHSARIYNGDYLISKWGQMGTFIHQKNDCPYDSTTLKYYKRSNISISGPSTVYLSDGSSPETCVYSINNDLPDGCSIFWSVESSYNSGYSFASITTDPTLSSISASVEGDATFTASITSPYNRTVSFKKTVAPVYLFPLIRYLSSWKDYSLVYDNYLYVRIVTNRTDPAFVDTWKLYKGGIITHNVQLIDPGINTDASFLDQPSLIKLLIFNSPGTYSLKVECENLTGKSTLTTDIIASYDNMTGWSFSNSTPVITTSTNLPPPPPPIP